jgi:hypothetical protein
MSERKTWWKTGVIVGASLVLCMLAGSSRGLMNYSNNPDLAQAMRFDPETNRVGMRTADRAKAEYYYLKYLEQEKESFQRARVYCQLGALYAVTFNREKGEEPNDAKARQYYKKVLEFEPQRIGRPTMTARSMLIGLDHPAGMERIRAAMEHYRWLASWDEAKVRAQWLPLWKPGTRPPVPTAEVKGVGESTGTKMNAVFEEEKQPSAAQVRATLGELKTDRECVVYNAAYDAASMSKPEEGFQYIREHLPPNAPERKQVEEIARATTTERAVDEAAQELLNSLFPTAPRIQDANAFGARPPDMGGAAPEWAVRRRFIPHLKAAAQQPIPFILDLNTGTKVTVGEPNATGAAQVYELLTKAQGGDLAWDGRFLTIGAVRLLPAREEAARPFKSASAPYGGTYELPKDVHPPYALVACDRQGTHYLIKVFRILPGGVDLFYRPLAPEEVPALLAPQAEK